jgi:serine/threonine-protein kinase
MISRGDEEIALSEDLVWCDVAAFTAAADSGLLMQALKLYRGELLPGLHLPDAWEFDRWLEQQRIEARERASAAAWALAQRFESNSQLSDAGRWARVAARYSDTDERALRRALQMLDRLGDRAGALKLYEDFARRLKTNLQADPSPETQLLVRQLRLAAHKAAAD